MEEEAEAKDSREIHSDIGEDKAVKKGGRKKNVPPGTGRFASENEFEQIICQWKLKLGTKVFSRLKEAMTENVNAKGMLPVRLLPKVFSEMNQSLSRSLFQDYMREVDLQPSDVLDVAELAYTYHYFFGTPRSRTRNMSEKIDSEDDLDERSSRDQSRQKLGTISQVAAHLASEGKLVDPEDYGQLIRQLSIGRTEPTIEMLLRCQKAFEDLDDDGDGEIALSFVPDLLLEIGYDATTFESQIEKLRKVSACISLVEFLGEFGHLIENVSESLSTASAVAKLRLHVPVSVARVAMQMVLSIGQKIISNPNTSQYWKIQISSPNFRAKVGQYPGGIELLQAIGFHSNDKTDKSKTWMEIKGARTGPTHRGKLSTTLSKQTLENLRHRLDELELEISALDGAPNVAATLRQIIEALGETDSHRQARDVADAMLVYVVNILKAPSDSKCWRIRQANPAFQKRIGQILPTETLEHQLMGSCGFHYQSTTEGLMYTLRGTSSSSSSSNSKPLKKFRFPTLTPDTESFLWRRKADLEAAIADLEVHIYRELGMQDDANRAMKDMEDSGHKQIVNKEKKQLDTENTPSAAKGLPQHGMNICSVLGKSEVQKVQLQMMKDAFQRYDHEKKGYISEANVRQYFRQNGKDASAPKVRAWIQSRDLDEDGVVSLEEFVAAFGPLLEHPLNDGRESSAVTAASPQNRLARAIGQLKLTATAIEVEQLLTYVITLLKFNLSNPTSKKYWRMALSDADMHAKLMSYPMLMDIFQVAGYVLEENSTVLALSNVTGAPFQSLPKELRKKLEFTITTLQVQERALEHLEISDVGSIAFAFRDMKHKEKWIVTLQTVLVYLQNVIQFPKEPKYRMINPTNAQFSKTIGAMSGGMELLIALGFRETQEGQLQLHMDQNLHHLRARKLELETGLKQLLQQHEIEQTKEKKQKQKIDMKDKVSKVVQRSPNKEQTQRLGGEAMKEKEFSHDDLTPNVIEMKKKIMAIEKEKLREAHRAKILESKVKTLQEKLGKTMTISQASTTLRMPTGQQQNVKKMAQQLGIDTAILSQFQSSSTSRSNTKLERPSPSSEKLKMKSATASSKDQSLITMIQESIDPGQREMIVKDNEMFKLGSKIRIGKDPITEEKLIINEAPLRVDSAFQYFHELGETIQVFPASTLPVSSTKSTTKATKSTSKAKVSKSKSRASSKSVPASALTPLEKLDNQNFVLQDILLPCIAYASSMGKALCESIASQHAYEQRLIPKSIFCKSQRCCINFPSSSSDRVAPSFLLLESTGTLFIVTEPSIWIFTEGLGIGALRSIFRELDQNGDQIIDFKDMVQAIKTHPYLQACFDRFSVKSKNKRKMGWTWPEFYGAFYPSSMSMGTDSAPSTSPKSGDLIIRELVDQYNIQEDRLHELQEIFRTYDTDGDGQLSQEEYRAVCWELDGVDPQDFLADSNIERLREPTLSFKKFVELRVESTTTDTGVGQKKASLLQQLKVSFDQRWNCQNKPNGPSGIPMILYPIEWLNNEVRMFIAPEETIIHSLFSPEIMNDSLLYQLYHVGEKYEEIGLPWAIIESLFSTSRNNGTERENTSLMYHVPPQCWTISTPKPKKKKQPIIVYEMVEDAWNNHIYVLTTSGHVQNWQVNDSDRPPEMKSDVMIYNMGASGDENEDVVASEEVQEWLSVNNSRKILKVFPQYGVLTINSTFGDGQFRLHNLQTGACISRIQLDLVQSEHSHKQSKKNGGQYRSNRDWIQNYIYFESIHCILGSTINGHLCIYSAASGEIVSRLDTMDSSCSLLHYVSNTKHLLTAGTTKRNCEIEIWDLDQHLFRPHLKRVSALSSSSSSFQKLKQQLIRGQSALFHQQSPGQKQLNGYWRYGTIIIDVSTKHLSRSRLKQLISIQYEDSRGGEDDIEEDSEKVQLHQLREVIEAIENPTEGPDWSQTPALPDAGTRVAIWQNNSSHVFHPLFPHSDLVHLSSKKGMPSNSNNKYHFVQEWIVECTELFESLELDLDIEELESWVFTLNRHTQSMLHSQQQKVYLRDFCRLLQTDDENPDEKYKLQDLIPSKHTLSGHQNGVLALAYLPIAQVIVSSSKDGTIRVWDPLSNPRYRLTHPLNPPCIRWGPGEFDQASAFQWTKSTSNTPYEAVLVLNLDQDIEKQSSRKGKHAIQLATCSFDATPTSSRMNLSSNLIQKAAQMDKQNSQQLNSSSPPSVFRGMMYVLSSGTAYILPCIGFDIEYVQLSDLKWIQQLAHVQPEIYTLYQQRQTLTSIVYFHSMHSIEVLQSHFSTTKEPFERLEQELSLQMINHVSFCPSRFSPSETSSFVGAQNHLHSEFDILYGMIKVPQKSSKEPLHMMVTWSLGRTQVNVPALEMYDSIPEEIQQHARNAFVKESTMALYRFRTKVSNVRTRLAKWKGTKIDLVHQIQSQLRQSFFDRSNSTLNPYLSNAFRSILSHPSRTFPIIVPLLSWGYQVFQKLCIDSNVEDELKNLSRGDFLHLFQSKVDAHAIHGHFFQSILSMWNKKNAQYKNKHDAQHKQCQNWSWSKVQSMIFQFYTQVLEIGEMYRWCQELRQVSPPMATIFEFIQSNSSIYSPFIVSEQEFISQLYHMDCIRLAQQDLNTLSNQWKELHKSWQEEEGLEAPYHLSAIQRYASILKYDQWQRDLHQVDNKFQMLLNQLHHHAFVLVSDSEISHYKTSHQANLLPHQAIPRSRSISFINWKIIGPERISGLTSSRIKVFRGQGINEHDQTTVPLLILQIQSHQGKSESQHWERIGQAFQKLNQNTSCFIQQYKATTLTGDDAPPSTRFFLYESLSQWISLREIFDTRGYFAGSDQMPILRFWMKQLLVGLHYLHTNGMSLRQFKPEQLMLSSDGSQLKIASVEYLTSWNATTSCIDTLSISSNDLYPSSGYIPPEAFKMKQRSNVSLKWIVEDPIVDQMEISMEELVAWDIWQFGAVLFEALSGKPPPVYSSFLYSASSASPSNAPFYDFFSSFDTCEAHYTDTKVIESEAGPRGQLCFPLVSPTVTKNYHSHPTALSQALHGQSLSSLLPHLVSHNGPNHKKYATSALFHRILTHFGILANLDEQEIDDQSDTASSEERENIGWQKSLQLKIILEQHKEERDHESMVGFDLMKYVLDQSQFLISTEELQVLQIVIENQKLLDFDEMWAFLIRQSCDSESTRPQVLVSSSLATVLDLLGICLDSNPNHRPTAQTLLTKAPFFASISAPEEAQSQAQAASFMHRNEVHRSVVFQHDHAAPVRKLAQQWGVLSQPPSASSSSVVFEATRQLNNHVQKLIEYFHSISKEWELVLQNLADEENEEDGEIITSEVHTKMELQRQCLLKDLIRFNVVHDIVTTALVLYYQICQHHNAFFLSGQEMIRNIVSLLQFCILHLSTSRCTSLDIEIESLSSSSSTGHHKDDEMFVMDIVLNLVRLYTGEPMLGTSNSATSCSYWTPLLPKLSERLIRDLLTEEGRGNPQYPFLRHVIQSQSRLAVRRSKSQPRHIFLRTWTYYADLIFLVDGLYRLFAEGGSKNVRSKQHALHDIGSMLKTQHQPASDARIAANQRAQLCLDIRLDEKILGFLSARDAKIRLASLEIVKLAAEGADCQRKRWLCPPQLVQARLDLALAFTHLPILFNLVQVLQNPKEYPECKIKAADILAHFVSGGDAFTRGWQHAQVIGALIKSRDKLFRRTLSQVGGGGALGYRFSPQHPSASSKHQEPTICVVMEVFRRICEYGPPQLCHLLRSHTSFVQLLSSRYNLEVPAPATVESLLWSVRDLIECEGTSSEMVQTIQQLETLFVEVLVPTQEATDSKLKELLTYIWTWLDQAWSAVLEFELTGATKHISLQQKEWLRDKSAITAACLSLLHHLVLKTNISLCTPAMGIMLHHMGESIPYTRDVPTDARLYRSKAMEILSLSLSFNSQLIREYPLATIFCHAFQNDMACVSASIRDQTVSMHVFASYPLQRASRRHLWQVMLQDSSPELQQEVIQSGLIDYIMTTCLSNTRDRFQSTSASHMPLEFQMYHHTWPCRQEALDLLEDIVVRCAPEAGHVLMNEIVRCCRREHTSSILGHEKMLCQRLKPKRLVNSAFTCLQLLCKIPDELLVRPLHQLGIPIKIVHYHQSRSHDDVDPAIRKWWLAWARQEMASDVFIEYNETQNMDDHKNPTNEDLKVEHELALASKVMNPKRHLDPFRKQMDLDVLEDDDQYELRPAEELVNLTKPRPSDLPSSTSPRFNSTRKTRLTPIRMKLNQMTPERFSCPELIQYLIAQEILPCKSDLEVEGVTFSGQHTAQLRAQCRNEAVAKRLVLSFTSYCNAPVQVEILNAAEPVVVHPLPLELPVVEEEKEDQRRLLPMNKLLSRLGSEVARIKAQFDAFSSGSSLLPASQVSPCFWKLGLTDVSTFTVSELATQFHLKINQAIPFSTFLRMYGEITGLHEPNVEPTCQWFHIKPSKWVPLPVSKQEALQRAFDTYRVTITLKPIDDASSRQVMMPDQIPEALSLIGLYGLEQEVSHYLYDRKKVGQAVDFQEFCRCYCTLTHVDHRLGLRFNKNPPVVPDASAAEPTDEDAVENLVRHTIISRSSPLSSRSADKVDSKKVSDSRGEPRKASSKHDREDSSSNDASFRNLKAVDHRTKRRKRKYSRKNKGKDRNNSRALRDSTSSVEASSSSSSSSSDERRSSSSATYHHHRAPGKTTLTNQKQRETLDVSEAVQRAFELYDVDGDGQVSFEDLRTVFNARSDDGRHIPDIALHRWIASRKGKDDDDGNTRRGGVTLVDFAENFAHPVQDKWVDDPKKKVKSSREKRNTTFRVNIKPHSRGSSTQTKKKNRTQTMDKTDNRGPGQRLGSCIPKGSSQRVVASSEDPESSRAMRRVFEHYDSNGDGEISFLDLKKVFVSQGRDMQDRDIREWIQARDTSGLGTVSFEDFVRSYLATSSSSL